MPELAKQEAYPSPGPQSLFGRDLCCSPWVHYPEVTALWTLTESPLWTFFCGLIKVSIKRPKLITDQNTSPRMLRRRLDLCSTTEPSAVTYGMMIEDARHWVQGSPDDRQCRDLGYQ